MRGNKVLCIVVMPVFAALIGACASEAPSPTRTTVGGSAAATQTPRPTTATSTPSGAHEPCGQTGDSRTVVPGIDASMKERATTPVGDINDLNRAIAAFRASLIKKSPAKNGTLSPRVLEAIGRNATAIHLANSSYGNISSDQKIDGYTRCWDLRTNWYDGRERNVYWDVEVNSSTLSPGGRQEDRRAQADGFPIGYVWMKINPADGTIQEVRWTART